MPDQFQGYAYLSYSSPPGGADSPASAVDTGSGSSGTSVGFTPWTRDHELDALYSCEPDALPSMTDEELFDYVASMPLDSLLPETQDQALPPFLIQGFPYAQNGKSSGFRPTKHYNQSGSFEFRMVMAAAQNTLPTLPAPTSVMAKPNLSNMPRTRVPPNSNQPTEPTQLLSPFRPRPHAPLPPLVPVPPNLPPTPPHSSVSVRHPHSSASSAVGASYWPPVPPTGERERLALPAPGDLSYSPCEVIM